MDELIWNTARVTEEAGEVADVVFTALVAIESLGLDARSVVSACATKVQSRLA